MCGSVGRVTTKQYTWARGICVWQVLAKLHLEAAIIRHGRGLKSHNDIEDGEIRETRVGDNEERFRGLSHIVGYVRHSFSIVINVFWQLHHMG
jgi:hypothetical protein